MSTFKVEVVKIKDVQPHPNADRLDLATINGWQCITQKGKYQPGDLAIYIPIDSILPVEVEAKLFGPESKIKLSKSRVKTIKLRGAISQGMLADPELFDIPAKEGYDATSELKIVKFEPPAPPANMQSSPIANRRKNPNFREYGGLDNFKHYPDLFVPEEHVAITEKIHGTNFRFGWIKAAPDTWFKRILAKFKLLPEYEFVFGSNRVQISNKLLYKGYYETNVYAEAVAKYNLKERTKNHKGVLFYGEIYGSGIQKNYDYGCKQGERKLIIFDIMTNTDTRDFMDYDDMRLVATALGFDVVPELYVGPFDAVLAKKLTEGASVLVPSQKVREGVVIKPYKEQSALIGRKILKLISDEYLLGDQSDFH